MGSGAYFKETHQRPSVLGFNEMEKVFKPYVGINDGLG